MGLKRFSSAASALLVLAFVGLPSCKENDDSPTNTGGNDTLEVGTELPAGFDQFEDDVEVYLDGEYVVVKTKDIPNHGSPYFSPTDSRYEAYSGSNPTFRLNPNRIQEQNLTFRIPRNPVEDPNHRATPMGPIGVAVNGVAFYNQYAAGGAPLTGEINSFDQYNGHPQNSGQYHYHVDPLYLTATRGKDALLGFLVDGFPVYGPQENGSTVTDADLDDYHGHIGPTREYPNGIYHYHITAEDPYLNGAGFFGVSGTVAQ